MKYGLRKYYHKNLIIHHDSIMKNEWNITRESIMHEDWIILMDFIISLSNETWGEEKYYTCGLNYAV